MAKICLCLTAKTLGRNLEILEKYRAYADIAELRVDCLDPNERLLIRRFPGQAGIPVILAIRRAVDGGFFEGGEGARVHLMAKGLAYADTDKRHNFAYLEIDKDLTIPSLEEAARTFRTRIIRSCYNFKGSDAELASTIRSICHSEDELAKIEVAASSITDVHKLLRAARECPKQEKILVALGHYGTCSKILAEQFGSFLSYAGAHAEKDTLMVPGDIDAKDLGDLYRFRKITKATRLFGIIGYPLNATGGLHFFNTTFKFEDMDAVYVPFPSDSIKACMELAQDLNVEGLSVTVPYKESVIPFLDSKSAEVQSIGACNAMRFGDQGWAGVNTEAKGFSDSVVPFIDHQRIRRLRATVIGAGASAKAVIFELHRMGAKVLVLHRAPHQARELASPYQFAWGGLGSQGIGMIPKFNDIIIQATLSGVEDINADAQMDSANTMATYNFTGREKVMDLMYKSEVTPFLKPAMDAGCKIQNGYDMLIRQSQYQYAYFMGREFPEHLLSRVGPEYDVSSNPAGS
jgi:3-dehydroquinate dehydratase/shikimate dehydrogenase